MEHHDFDRLVRSMATGVSRRSILRRVAGSAVASPLALLGGDAARAGGKKDKDRKKDKDKGNGNGNQVVVAAGCRDVGHPCMGNQECCSGLVCGSAGPGAALRCATPGMGSAGTNTAQANQTVVQTNNQVCAGNCDQSNQQTVQNQINQAVIGGNTQLFGVPPTYRVDVNCTFDEPKYRSTCTGTGHGNPGAPRVDKITLPPSGLCAVVITEETRPETRRPGNVPNAPSSGQASAGNGGVANADASGGSVTIGNVNGGGSTNVSVNASGGTANADASGGNNNVAVVGGGQVAGNAAEQVVDLSTITLTLEGKVVPGRQTTYWVDTDAGRRPASGPSLVQVADETDTTGAIVVQSFMCNIPSAQQGYDWFGQCTAPAANLSFSVYSQPGGTTPVATLTSNAEGRANFGNLPPGTYELRPEGTIWCYAESDRVDANGNVLVEAGAESHVWNFVCSGPAGS